MLFDIIWCLFIELIENGIIFKKRTKHIEIRIMVSKSYNTLYFVPNADLKKNHCSENTLNEDSHWSNHCPLLSTKNMLLRLSVNFVVISSIFWRNFQWILSHLLLISLIEFLLKKTKKKHYRPTSNVLIQIFRKCLIYFTVYENHGDSRQARWSIFTAMTHRLVYGCTY